MSALARLSRLLGEFSRFRLAFAVVGLCVSIALLLVPDVETAVAERPQGMGLMRSVGLRLADIVSPKERETWDHPSPGPCGRVAMPILLLLNIGAFAVLLPFLICGTPSIALFVVVAALADCVWWYIVAGAYERFRSRM